METVKETPSIFLKQFEDKIKIAFFSTYASTYGLADPNACLNILIRGVNLSGAHKVTIQISYSRFKFSFHYPELSLLNQKDAHLLIIRSLQESPISCFIAFLSFLSLAERQYNKVNSEENNVFNFDLTNKLTELAKIIIDFLNVHPEPLCNFNYFEKICQILNIEINDIPENIIIYLNSFFLSLNEVTINLNDF